MSRGSILAFLMLTTGAHADAIPDRVTFLIGSKHFGLTNPQESNPGLFLTWDTKHVSFTAGAYRNSFDGPSAALFVSRSLYQKSDFSVSVFGGIAYYPGYGSRFLIRSGDIVPMVGIEAQWRAIVIQAMPGLVSYGLRFSLK